MPLCIDRIPHFHHSPFLPSASVALVQNGLYITSSTPLPPYLLHCNHIHIMQTKTPNNHRALSFQLTGNHLIKSIFGCTQVVVENNLSCKMESDLSITCFTNVHQHSLVLAHSAISDQRQSAMFSPDPDL